MTTTPAIVCPNCGEDDRKRLPYVDSAVPHWRCLTCGNVIQAVAAPEETTGRATGQPKPTEPTP